MKPLIWAMTNDVEQNGYALFNNTLRKTYSYIFMGGKQLPSSDVGNLKYSQNPQEYDLVYTHRYSEKHLKRFDCLPNNGQTNELLFCINGGRALFHRDNLVL